jgi:mannose-6-phosphate isomerase-like protein (cupin superfamily)
MHPLILDQNKLPANRGTREWEGGLSSNANLSLILVDLSPGEGPRLHRHPYQEVIVVHKGNAVYTIGSTIVTVCAGQIVIVPKGVPHKFINSGPGRLRQTDIHLSGTFETEWLEIER